MKELNWKENRDLLTAYVFDDVTPEEKNEVETLLERDPEAAAEVEALRKMGTLVSLVLKHEKRDYENRTETQSSKNDYNMKTNENCTKKQKHTFRNILALWRRSALGVTLFLGTVSEKTEKAAFSKNFHPA